MSRKMNSKLKKKSSNPCGNHNHSTNDALVEIAL